MRIPGLLLSLAGLLALNAVGAGPTKEPLYFPVEKGTRLVFEGGGAGMTWEVTRSVVRVENEKGVSIVTVEESWSTAKDKVEYVYRVSPEGIHEISRWGKKNKTPAPVLKLPAKEGEVVKYETEHFKERVTTSKEEQIVVPAGKYKAISVTSVKDYAFTDGGKVQKFALKSVIWYAPGVGAVKQVDTIDGGPETITVLKSVSKEK